MEAVTLVDQSAEVALQHVLDLHRMMRDQRESSDPQVRECCRLIHELVGDVASVRNAAYLLRKTA
ncbi:hypothetical protein ASC77_07210 [Nocardioides sp. Root1257]|uniref:hypothetical protein n=1 Tax=unclassified Nocardioides TaxID=2615069 RepID=UPI0006F3B5FC|nr:MULTISPECIES: hypothetical protein [unclassified Nocardioides]KQW48531.1 hypothetical protein ASC77_07210 [Nocardioides sp. Root1257]KRC47707.1 hypothetical protein ASE24_07215 [Nocardioides sp. Root224]